MIYKREFFSERSKPFSKKHINLFFFFFYKALVEELLLNIEYTELRYARVLANRQFLFSKNRNLFFKM